MLEILCVGNANIDFIINSSSLSKEDVTPILMPGGSASNFAVGCARLGLKTGFAGFVGKDSFGTSIINNFKHYGVKPLVKIINEPTGIVVIFTKGTFKKMIRYPGANEALSKLNLKQYSAKAKHIHLATPHLSLLNQLKYFHSTSVDLGSSLAKMSFEELKSYFKYISVFLPNQEEIELICKCNYKNAARMILDAGCKVVAIKRAKEGCFATDGKQEINVKAIQTQKIIDTTGAGDSFDSAFINAWLKNLDLRTACMHGLASSHINIQKLGAQDMPTSNEINRTIDEYKKSF